MVPAPETFANPNEAWLHARGAWFTYILVIVVLRIVIAIVFPFLTVEWIWCITNLLHNVVTLGVLHFVKGSPFGEDHGKYARLTTWEQIDDEQQFTDTRKFFTAVPIVLFFIANHYTENDIPFWINAVSSLIAIVAKLPQMHKVRIFGISRY
eukprot:Clim_evm103s149 gene=Clim_evmTU103s149